MTKLMAATAETQDANKKNTAGNDGKQDTFALKLWVSRARNAQEINTRRHLTYKQTIPKKTKGPTAFRRLSRRGRDTNETWLPASLAPWNQHIRKLGDDSLRLRRVFVLLNSPEVSSSCWHLHGVWALPSRPTGLQHTRKTQQLAYFQTLKFCPSWHSAVLTLMIMITVMITLRKK